MFEEITLLRTKESYAEGVLLADPSVTGIKEECIFNQLPTFETPTDICVDQFHDVIEGIAHYTLIPVLKHFHSLNNIFISTLNNRLYSIDLGLDSENWINLHRLLQKDKLKMTGSEMFTFIRVFGVLVYDMIPEGDLYYQLYLLLNDITSIVQAKGLPQNGGKIFSIMVKEHNQLYMSLLGENLKPKHHLLVHYSRLLAMIGPFNAVSTVRFEAKHHLLKMTANTCMSRVNLSKTIAIKQQLGFSFRCLTNASLRPEIEIGPSHLINLKELNNFKSFSLSLPETILMKPLQNVSNWIIHNGTQYRRKQVLVFDVDDLGLYQFCEIELILVYDKKPLFLCSVLNTLGYFSEVRGYEVQHETNPSWIVLPQANLLDPHPLSILSMSSGEMVIVLKYAM